MGRLTEERDAATYRASEQRAEIDGRSYRAAVVASDHLDQRKEKTPERQLREKRKRPQQAPQAVRPTGVEGNPEGGSRPLTMATAIHRPQDACRMRPAPAGLRGSG